MKKNSFEENLDSLKKLVDNLDGKELSLDETLKNFEEGISHYRKCYKFIEDAEQKITVLIDGLEKDFDTKDIEK